MTEDLSCPGPDEIREAFRQALITTFCRVLEPSRLPPVTVLAAAAAAIREVYDEVAEAHLAPAGCPCGWLPVPGADIATLVAALEGSVRPAEIVDLRAATVLGRA